MSPQENFDTIRSLSDDQILRMLEGNPQDYQPSAWKAACEELQKRGGKDLLVQKAAEEERKCAETAGLVLRGEQNGRPRANYLWFYVRVISLATVGNAGLGMNYLDPLFRWALIAAAAAYSMLLTRVMRLAIAFAITLGIGSLLLGAGMTVSRFTYTTGSFEKAASGLVVALFIEFFKVAGSLMLTGLIFHGISKGIGKLRGGKL